MIDFYHRTHPFLCVLAAAGAHGMNIHAHVIVGGEWEDALPITDEAAMILDDIPESERTSGSRLACCITLTKEMDGMNVAVPLPKGPNEIP